MKITARRSKYVWKISRLLFVAVPLSQAITAGFDHEWFDVFPWVAMAWIVLIMIHMERRAFHHGYHFGMIMVMWCIRREIDPEEFAEMPCPEPWDLPWREKTDDHEA